MSPQRSASHPVGADDTAALARQLSAQLDGRYAFAVVSAAVSQAVRDLRGSINIDGLPEMVFRLVHYRLTGARR